MGMHAAMEGEFEQAQACTAVSLRDRQKVDGSTMLPSTRLTKGKEEAFGRQEVNYACGMQGGEAMT